MTNPNTQGDWTARATPARLTAEPQRVGEQLTQFVANHKLSEHLEQLKVLQDVIPATGELNKAVHLTSDDYFVAQDLENALGVIRYLGNQGLEHGDQRAEATGGKDDSVAEAHLARRRRQAEEPVNLRALKKLPQTLLNASQVLTRAANQGMEMNSLGLDPNALKTVSQQMLQAYDEYTYQKLNKAADILISFPKVQL